LAHYFKDSYVVEFLSPPEQHSEQDLHRGLLDWIADLVARALSPAVAPESATLLEALGDESLAGADLPMPKRTAGRNRLPQFP
jgi:hypothetical protein